MMFSSGLKVDCRCGIDDDFPAGEALAGVIVGVAFQFERDSLGEEATEALAGGAVELEMDRVFGQAGVAIFLGDFAREHRPDGAVDVLDRHFRGNFFPFFNRGLGDFDELVVQGDVQAVILLLHIADRDVRTGFRAVEHDRQIQTLRLPVMADVGEFEPLNLADHVVEFAVAQLGHVAANFLGDEEHEVDHVLGLAGEFLAQLRDPASRFPPGRCSGGRPRIMMQPVAISGPVLNPNSSAPSRAAMTTSRPVLNWPSVCNTIRPRRSFITRVCCVSATPSSQGRPGVFDARQGRRAGSAAVAADENMIGLGLGDARGDGADADFADQFHAHARVAIAVLQIVNELRQILD